MINRCLNKILAFVLVIVLVFSGISTFSIKATDSIVEDTKVEKETQQITPDKGVDDYEEQEESEEQKLSLNLTLKYNSGKIVIHRLDKQQNAVEKANLRLYTTNDNGTPAKELDVFEGMKFYLVSSKNTDKDGNVIWDNLSISDDDWYLAVDELTGNIINIGTLPYRIEDEILPSYDGRISKIDDCYYLYDIEYNVYDNEAKTVLPINNGDITTIMPTLLTTSEVSAQSSSKYSWTYKLWSAKGVRSSTVKITGRADFYYGGTKGSIFKESGDIYASCAQHAKSTPATGTTVKESVYTGNNAAKIRKLLYYGYGGYDNGKTFIKAYKSKVDSSYLAFASVVCMSYYYSGVSCWDNWNVIKTLKEVISDNNDPAGSDIANAATEIHFKNSSGDNITTAKAHLAKDDNDYKNNSYYYSNWITLKSDGKKEIKLSTSAGGVSVYRKRSGNVSGPRQLDSFTYKSGDKIKLRFDKDKCKASSKVKVTLSSEGGIVSYKAILGKTTSSYQDVMRACVTTATDKSTTLTLTMPSEPTVETPNPPTYGSTNYSDNMTQKVDVLKKSEDGTRLPGAVIQIVNGDGVTKTIKTDATGKGSVLFNYSATSKNYRYLTNASSLTAAQIENALASGIYKSYMEAYTAAKAEVSKKLNVARTYRAKEIVAPEGFYIDSTEKQITSSALTLTFEFVNQKIEPEKPKTANASYETYYYQELDIGKVDYLDHTLALPDTGFDVQLEEVSDGSTLIGILYTDREGREQKMFAEEGISIEVTRDKYEKHANGEEGEKPKYNTLRSVYTNAQGVTRVGYVYKIWSKGNYSYIKDYDNLTGGTKEIADEWIRTGQYFRYKDEADAAAKIEVTKALSNICNKYYARETKKTSQSAPNGNEYYELTEGIKTDIPIYSYKELEKYRFITSYTEVDINNVSIVYNRNKNMEITNPILTLNSGW